MQNIKLLYLVFFTVLYFFAYCDEIFKTSKSNKKKSQWIKI